MCAKIANYGWTEVKDFNSLKNLDHQPMGPRHTPVPHFFAIEFFKEKLLEHNIVVTNEHAVMSPDTYKLIYLADVKPANEKVDNDFTYSIGFLNNNDRSRAFTGIAGTRVFVNNAQMYVSEGAFKTRHCTNVREYLNDRIGHIITWFKEYQDIQTGRIEKMKSTKCTDEMLGNVVLNYIRKPYSISATNVKKIVKEFDKPRHEVFTDKTLWALQNTTSEVFAKIKSPLFRLEAMEIFAEAIEPYLK